MTRTKITMREAIFYKLYTHFKSEKREAYIPVFELIGEVWCEEVRRFGFISFEVSARLSELFKHNPGLFQRQAIRGKSGARYYGYRIAPHAVADMVADVKLREFYELIKRT